MDIDIDSDTSGATVLKVRGRLNLVSAAQLRTAVDDAVTAGSSRVVIDLGETDSIDSSGLGAIVAGLKRTRQAGGDLRIARPNDQIKTVLKLTNMNRVFQEHDSVASAIKD